jgi:hypothetical protein
MLIIRLASVGQTDKGLAPTVSALKISAPVVLPKKYSCKILRNKIACVIPSTIDPCENAQKTRNTK